MTEALDPADFVNVKPFTPRGGHAAVEPLVPLPTFRASRFSGIPLPQREWHVEGLIPAHNVTLLMADGATGKSTIAVHLGALTVLGRPWFGRACKQGPVLYLNAEDDLDEVHRRLDAVTAHEGVEFAALDGLVIVPMAGRDAVLAAPDARDGLLKPTPMFAALRDRVAAERPALLILDTLSDLFGGDEIKKVQARQFVTMLRGLAVDFRMAVLLIGHPSQSGMATGAGTSGNVAWSNSVRSRLYLERVKTAEGLEIDPDVRTLTVKKTNYSQAGLSITLRWQDGVFVSEIGAPPRAGPGLAAHAEDVFLDLLGQFEREGRNVSATPSNTYAPKLFAEHPDGHGVNKKAFQTAMNTLLSQRRIAVDEFGPPSKRRSRLVIAPVPEASSD